MTAPLKPRVYVCEGFHWNIPGRPRTVHTSRLGAHLEAAGLVNIFLKDMGRPAKASERTWGMYLGSVKLARCRDTGEAFADCDVSVEWVELKG